MLNKLCGEGRLGEAIWAVRHMVRGGGQVSINILICLLQGCIRNNDLISGRHVHAIIIELDLLWNNKLMCYLIRMFALCGSMPEAMEVFITLKEQNLYTWTAIIFVHAYYGQGEQAIMLFNQMQLLAVQPSSYTYVAVLKACARTPDVDRGKLIYAKIVTGGIETDVYIGNALIDMFAKSGSLDDACNVFVKLPIRDIVSWNAMIAGYIEHGHNQQALQVFHRMQSEGTEANKVTFVCILKACSRMEALGHGKLIHCDIIKQGLQSDLFIGNVMVDMYAKSDSVEVARNLFNKLVVRNVVSWNAMIEGYAQGGYGHEALQVFQEMLGRGTQPNEVTYLSALKACASIEALNQGKQIHAFVLERGLGSRILIGSILVDMYAKCGSLKEARGVFDQLLEKSLVSWNAMIAGCADNGQAQEALQLFKKMHEEGIEPNEITIVCILKSCTCIGSLDWGRHIHFDFVKQGLQLDLFVGSMLVDMYAKCGSLDDAQSVFVQLPSRNVVTWSAMIAAYAEHGHGEKSLHLLKSMQQECVEPNEITFVSVLKACTCIPSLAQGKSIHDDIMKRGLMSNPLLGNTAVDMYARCGSLEDAHDVFVKLPKRDTVSWNAMIVGYMDHGYEEEAIQLFVKMQEDTDPSEITFISILKACASLAAIYQGKLIHTDIAKRSLESCLSIGNTLVDMYAKCGSLEDACTVFYNLPVRDVVSWSAMIAGFANHGYYKLSWQHFVSMQKEGINPDCVTFINLLSSCNHTGLIQEAHCYFHSMREEYGITPTIEHYICMIDLLGRAGCLEESENLVMNMPYEPDTVVWVALLGSCAKHGNIVVGKRAFDCLVKYDSSNAAGYVLMSSIYAANSMWEHAEKIIEMQVHIEAYKMHGKTWLAANEKAYDFSVNG